MSAPHFFAGAPEPGEPVVLDPDDARHAIRSLRLRPGDELTSADGEGAVARCRILRADRLLVEAEVEERWTVERPSPEVVVLLAPPKGERLTWAVQKLTELGVDEIGLVEAPRSVRRWEGDRAERIAVRLDGVAREAAKQSRRAFLPRIGGPMPWVEAAAPTGGLVVLWEGAGAVLASLGPSILRTETAAVAAAAVALSRYGRLG